MNGICEITVSGKKHRLEFGMIAVEEFQRLSLMNPSKNVTKIITDLIYSGILNRCINDLEPAPAYREIAALVQEVSKEPDFEAQWATVLNCYELSKNGGEEIKKKDGERPKQKKSTSKQLSALRSAS